MMKETTRLSNMQLELLKLYHINVSDEDLKEIKLLLAKYFADKASDEMDKLWEKNNWSNETMKDWEREHVRSSKKSD
jgi:hypothetical protein